ncbi:YicC/YloC family endoribonuclease [Pleomorphomonas sp. PLEO]|uniref:YicC/YloC family endoribonuclease n=1 Tax=Pleomorphomonas sp. PLEO TaxID=3239306 RepID=UPI00351E6CDC
MPLKSMTGFARVDGSAAGNRFAWELRSVNGRGLDLRLRLPTGFDAVEVAVRRKASEALARGNVSINLTVTRETSAQTFRIDENLLSALIDTARRYSGTPGIREASLDGLLAVRGVVELVEAAPDEDSAKAFEAELVAAFGRVLTDFQASRASEGLALTRILGEQVDEVARLVTEVEALPARTPEVIRDRLEEQLAALLSREDIDPQRLHLEAALIATRADVREEIDRLKAHIAQARELMASDAAVGRRLDFLAQEFNRESNTLCSKSNDTALTRIGLSLKAVVDQFKEQVQNVE